MKKKLLTLGTALLLSVGAFAQKTEVYPTNSQLSGNDTTFTNKGYKFNFNNPYTYNASAVNCMNKNSGIMNSFSATSYGIYYDTINSYAVLSFDGTQSNGFGSKKNTGDRFLWNRLPSGNCNPTTIDVSETNSKIRAKIKSSVAVLEFYIGVVVDQDGNAVLADSDFEPTNTKTLKAGEWTEVEFSISRKGWYNSGVNLVDLDKTIGLFFTVRDKDALDDASTPKGEIAIDWIEIGDAGSIITQLSDSEKENLDVKVFPNPASDVVNVSYNVPADEQVTVTLSNSLGQAVASVEGDASSASIDVAELNSGLYFASVVVDGIVLETQKVIIE